MDGTQGKAVNHKELSTHWLNRQLLKMYLSYCDLLRDEMPLSQYKTLNVLCR